MNNIDFRINDIAYWTDGNLHSIQVETGFSLGLRLQHRRYAEEVLNVEYEFIK